MFKWRTISLKNCLDLFFCPNYEIFSSTILLKEFHWLNFLSQWFLPFVYFIQNRLTKKLIVPKKVHPNIYSKPNIQIGNRLHLHCFIKNFYIQRKAGFLFLPKWKKGSMTRTANRFFDWQSEEWFFK